MELSAAHHVVYPRLVAAKPSRVGSYVWFPNFLWPTFCTNIKVMGVYLQKRQFHDVASLFIQLPNALQQSTKF